jgi:hypothetical protein
MIDEVRAVNQAFYDAHEAASTEAMSAVWEHSDRVVCVHPGWPILRGWPTVHEAWRQIFAGPHRNQFILTNEAIAVHGDVAWVTVDENLVSIDGGAASSKRTIIVNVNVATRDHKWFEMDEPLPGAIVQVAIPVGERRCVSARAAARCPKTSPSPRVTYQCSLGTVTMSI